jgi:hypothetical protein
MAGFDERENSIEIVWLSFQRRSWTETTARSSCPKMGPLSIGRFATMAERQARSNLANGSRQKTAKSGGLTGSLGLAESRQNAGFDGQNQYVAARNRLDGPTDTLVRIVPRPEIQESQL